MLWRSRGPLYKVALIALLAITPFNILSVVLPFWLEVEGKVALGDPDQATSRKERLHYGIWELCSDSLGCSWVHNTNSDAGVGCEWNSVCVYVCVCVCVCVCIVCV